MRFDPKGVSHIPLSNYAFALDEKTLCIRLRVSKNNVKEVIKLDTVLFRVIHDLLKDKSLYIDEFGVNYDEESYVMRSNALERSNYSLLAYTINQDILMNYV